MNVLHIFRHAFRVAAIILYWVAFTAISDTRASAAQFEKLLAFSSTNSVKVVAIVKSDAASVADISAKITHAQTGELLWQGSLGKLELKPGASSSITQSISNLKPLLWDTASPTLYKLEVTASAVGKVLATRSVNIGFRSFESTDGQFLLNGRPIFLRGLAINPPGRTVPDETSDTREFAEAYVGYMKSKNFNTIRLSHDSQIWFDVCDEMGMLIFQGQYASPLEGAPLKKGVPEDFEKSMASYKRLFETYASHPSIVIYILSNELPTSGPRGKAYSDFLTRACDTLKQWDSTRQYIGNAGYGEGREGDVKDVHRYWGWYYNTFLTFYNLRDEKLFGDPAKNQPLTFTECLGCFTGPNGEFNIIVRKQLGAQLCWTGHSDTQRDDALNYQAFEVAQVTESFRRLRSLNKHIAGLMPFTIGFANWSGITSFSQMHPNPSMDQFGISYQPVLLSWEMWTPQRYAGSTVQAIAHVINDADDGSNLTNVSLAYELRSSDGKIIFESKTNLPDVAYYGTTTHKINFTLPSNLATGDYILSGKIFSGSREVSHNYSKIFIAGRDWLKPVTPPASTIFLLDPLGQTAKALKQLGLSFQSLNDSDPLPSAPATLIIGENAWNESLTKRADTLKKFITDGGRILCLEQDPKKFDSSWLPERVEFFTASANDAKYPTPGRPYSGNMNINPERPNHPIFAGLDRHRLALWSDHTGWDQTKPGFPQLYPITAGFRLAETNALAHTAILADYDRGLEGVGLCEMFSGKGSVILSGFDLVNRAGFDPLADRLLANLVTFAAAKSGHDTHPFIEKPIQWGNYASEQGVVTGPLNGLLENADWVVPPTNPHAKPLTQEQGWWNTRPSDQFVTHGRQPFGPYEYSTSSSLRGLNSDIETGTGIFWARIPAVSKTMVTKIKNPTSSEASISITINEKSPTTPSKIPAGETLTIRTPLTFNDPAISVRYSGTRTLVLLETAFE